MCDWVCMHKFACAWVCIDDVFSFVIVCVSAFVFICMWLVTWGVHPCVCVYIWVRLSACPNSVRTDLISLYHYCSSCTCFIILFPFIVPLHCLPEVWCLSLSVQYGRYSFGLLGKENEGFVSRFFKFLLFDNFLVIGLFLYVSVNHTSIYLPFIYYQVSLFSVYQFASYIFTS